MNPTQKQFSLTGVSLNKSKFLPVISLLAVISLAIVFNLICAFGQTPSLSTNLFPLYSDTIRIRFVQVLPMGPNEALQTNYIEGILQTNYWRLAYYSKSNFYRSDFNKAMPSSEYGSSKGGPWSFFNKAYTTNAVSPGNNSTRDASEFKPDGLQNLLISVCSYGLPPFKRLENVRATNFSAVLYDDTKINGAFSLRSNHIQSIEYVFVPSLDALMKIICNYGQSNTFDYPAQISSYRIINGQQNFVETYHVVSLELTNVQDAEHLLNPKSLSLTTNYFSAFRSNEQLYAVQPKGEALLVTSKREFKHRKAQMAFLLAIIFVFGITLFLVRGKLKKT